MDFEGLLRSIWPTLYVVGGCFVFATVLWVILKAVAKKQCPPEVSKTLNKGYFILLGILAAIVVLRLLSVSFTDRVPRREIDRSGIYNQAEKRREEARKEGTGR